MTTPTAPRYAGLDGLRAVAVLLVVLYHLFPAWFLHSGFVGVDVFFVISGFLITSLLLRERAATGRIALRAFWTRRARRLLPALALVVTVSATLAWVIGGDVLVGLGRQVLGAATFSYNWTSIGAGASYFGSAEPELLRNLWSLAVEEQFYVLWPLLLPVLLLVRRRWLRAIVALALAAASALWGFAVAGEALTRAYYGTDTHAFGLLIGVALAFALGGERRRATRWARFGMPVAGAAVLVALVAVASVPGGAGLYPAIPLAASVLTAVVIATATAPGAMLGRALDVAPLRWIGERSYGIYLWHWPLVVLLTLAATGSFVDTAIPVTAGAAAGVLTLALSALSYRMLEQPVRRLGFAGAGRAVMARLRSTPVRRFGAIASLTAGLLVVGGTTAAVAAAPAVSSSEAVVEAGRQALTAASVAPAPPMGEGGSDATPAPDAPVTAAPDAAATDAADPDRLSGDGADNRSATGADGRPRPPAPAAVDGTRVTAVGDSVMLASAAGLLARLPGVQIDAEVSRSMWAGDTIVQQLAAQGALREYVVVGLGTNGPVDAQALQQIYDAIGRDRTLVFVNAAAPRDWIAGVNSDLAAFAATHPGVVVADWAQAIAPHPDMLAGDRIHPGPQGGGVYADTVAAAIDGVANQRAEVRYQVELIRWAADEALRGR
ncbi:MAG: acetyltransferase [Microbacterium hominis]|jgi:peptidoglycan/LPS O-acetylase OafA/YrhL|uniref:acyltransferase family protein n=1 Tax=Microbacterium aurum TaxID=36805 RepID=UPI00248D42A0|nr:acyltransferase family protein [Microbacterium aurum]MBZ6372455.1 acetyltransferase [Microbacterium hominis]